ncbi:MAG: extracellular solute-binding protein, partial [Pseudomonadota bacterium]
MKAKFFGIVLLLLYIPGGVAADVNVYSARKEQLIKPLLDRFTKETGIEVKLLTGKADALIRRLESEGSASPADVLITTDAGRLHRAKMMGLLQPVQTEFITSTVPDSMRDSDNQWFGLSIRSRPIMFARNRVSPDDLSSYEDLADDRWQGRICMRSSDNIYNQSLVTSMLLANGESQTLNWAAGVVDNLARAPAGGDIDQLKLLASGVCDVTVVNTYYLGLMLRGSDKKQRKAAKRIGIFWPNQADRGAHINVSGAGVTAASKNRDHAVALLEFLLNTESQLWYAKTNFE